MVLTGGKFERTYLSELGRGIYYGSYRAPRTLVWAIGTVILVLMMGTLLCPIWIVFNRLGYLNFSSGLLPFNRARTKALSRIGPHNKDILPIIICGMLGDWGAHEIKGQKLSSVRFSIEQSAKHSTYIHNLCSELFELGYCSSYTPKLIVRVNKIDNTTQYFYRVTLFTSTSLYWIYEGFYKNNNGVNVKVVPSWIGEYITPRGLAHLVMSIGSLNSKGLIFNIKIYNDIKGLNIIKTVLENRYNIKSTIISHTCEGEIIKVLCIPEEYIPILHSIINPYLYPSSHCLVQTNSLSSTDTVLSNNNITPVAIYNNADTQKELILNQNRGKAGVYRWTSKLSGKSYVGSSINLSKRFNDYYNYNHLVSSNRRNMLINRALLKYGYSNFMLEILEYCDKSRSIEREQYYLDFLKPDYNILTKASSSLGYKHSEETLLKMKGPKSPELLIKIRKHLKKLNSKPFAPSVRAKISAGLANFNVSTKGKKVVFTNINTNETLSFASLREAALAMKISRNTITKFALNQKVYGIYRISII